MEDLRQRGLRLADEIDSDEESDDEEPPDETFEEGIPGDPASPGAAGGREDELRMGGGFPAKFQRTTPR